MKQQPTYEDILGVMAKRSIGDTTARVALPAAPDPDDPISLLALALNSRRV